MRQLREVIKWDKKTRGEGLPLFNWQRIIQVNPTHLMQAHKETSPSYQETIGQGKIDRLKQHIANHKRVSLPEVGANNGRIGFDNGRHRAQLAAQLGHKSIPIAVEKGNEKEIQQILKRYRK